MTTTERPAPGPALPFFVYGTLRPGGTYHDPYLRGSTSAEEPGRLVGAVLYEGPGYPYAVATPDTRTVHGELITARPAAYARVLAALDRLEEFTVPGDPGNLYERVVRAVHRADGTTVSAWVYLAAPHVEARLLATGTLVTSGDWRAAEAAGAPRVPDGPRTP
ncbi:gamma-glutamylcyclotransferase family protein [Streptomyces sp. NPDC058001]|uniref:gamma-glutamylcyclotransferase family protein n=1 Tax=Streptomyces sp. NPDC058001 TaxID=3346300 RepID=UPI0036E8E485